VHATIYHDEFKFNFHVFLSKGTNSDPAMYHSKLKLLFLCFPYRRGLNSDRAPWQNEAVSDGMYHDKLKFPFHGFLATGAGSTLTFIRCSTFRHTPCTLKLYLHYRRGLNADRAPWQNESVSDGMSMEDVVKIFKPTCLLGLAAQPAGLFTEQMVSI